MNSLIYHGGSSASSGWSKEPTQINLTTAGNASAGNSGGFQPIIKKIEYNTNGHAIGGGFQPQSGSSIPSGLGIMMNGANVYNCTEIAGFTNRFHAIKLATHFNGTINELKTFTFNAYGSQEIEIGLYDLNGILLGRTGVIIAPPGQNALVISGLISPTTVIKNTGHWLGIWGNGVDIPLFNGFSNYNSTFPTGVHAIQHSSTTELPLIIDSSFPFQLTNLNIPITAIS